MNLTWGEAARVTGGTLAQGNPDSPLGPFSTDTRKLQPGDTFVALKGPNFDGDAFLPLAFEKGATGAFCHHPGDAPLPPGMAVLRVADTLHALSMLAQHWRRRLATPMIALTGSSGKTTTKEMLAHILLGGRRVLATKGNLNNHIGVPLTLLSLKPEHDIAVVEMGMNHSGELAELVRLAEPNLGVLTNIGDAHLGNFSGREALALAKSELLEGLPPGAPAIVNGDCEWSRWVVKHRLGDRPLRTFGPGANSVVRGENVRTLVPMGTEFDLVARGERAAVRLPLFGTFQVLNALAAATAALEFGVSVPECAARLCSFQPPAMRAQVEEIGGVRVIVDCYNASPAAVEAALESFAKVAVPGRRFVLLGDMLELGTETESSHRKIGAASQRKEFDAVLCAGESSRWTADTAGSIARHFERVEDAAMTLASQLAPGDALLVKGSRGSRMERAVDVLRSRLTAPQEQAL